MTPRRPKTHQEARGRGALSNDRSARFNDLARHATPEDKAARKHSTEISFEQPRTAITRNSSPDIEFDRSINAYRGCEHGCIYCYARPTHAYLGLSPGLDFESKLTVKRGLLERLKAEICRPSYVCRPIALGTNTDPYQPVERQYRLTRQILDMLEDAHHPVLITTKSARILDDLGILKRLARQNLAAVTLSATSLSPKLSRIMEPRASAPSRRLDAIKQLSKAGIPVTISLSPMIPAVNDTEIEDLISAGADAGAVHAKMIMLRLPHEVAPLFREWLQNHMPDRAAKVMHRVTEMRGGSDNEPKFHERFRAHGPYADMLRSRFNRARRRAGLDGPGPSLNTDLFLPPGAQLSLL